MNAGIFIYYTPSWEPLAEVVLPAVRKYCSKHDYRKCFLCSDEDEDWALNKITYLSFFDDLWEYDVLWVLDLDTLITNPEIRFTDFVDFKHDIFICKDVNGINAGSWIIRNTEASRRFVETIVNNFDAPHEQILMNRYLDMVKVKYLPHPSINSYKYELYDYGEKTHEEGQWQEGDLLLHLPGLSLEKRIEIFKEYENSRSNNNI